MDRSTILVMAVAAVGFLHTIVPDHWAPITLLARQRGWSWQETARAALLAGVGHTVSTLAIAWLVWIVGTTLAVRYGHIVSLLSSLGLIVFGAWIALASWREMSQSQHHAHFGHAHSHHHSNSTKHRHWHEHHVDDRHEAEDQRDDAPLHEHAHETSSRTWLLVILGSSPMIEGIPAFFAASRYGPRLLLIMTAVFAASTTITYLVLCLASTSGLQRMQLGRFEKYGEVISGSFVAVLGLVFLIFPSPY